MTKYAHAGEVKKQGSELRILRRHVELLRKQMRALSEPSEADSDDDGD